MHLFTDCLLSHRNGRAELWDKTIWPQTQDISYLPLYRKFADPFAVIIPIESLHPQQEQHTGGPCMWRRWRGDWSLEMSFLSLSTSCLTHGGSPVGVSPPPPVFSNFLHLLLLERELPSKPPRALVAQAQPWTVACQAPCSCLWGFPGKNTEVGGHALLQATSFLFLSAVP